MIGMMKTGAAGMNVQRLQLDNIGHNLSNMGTTGFKRRDYYFTDLIYQPVVQRGTPVRPEPPTGLMPQMGRGSTLISGPINMKPGSFLPTGRPLDLTISGQGFFGLEMEDGTTAYTRSGDFGIDSQGRLTDAAGNYVRGDLRAVPEEFIPETFSVSSSGEVKAVNAQGEEVDMGRLVIYHFENPSGLLQEGYHLLQATEASGPAVQGFPGEGETGSVLQGMLETSNVDITEEMSRLIMSSRYFQVNSRSLRLAEDMWQLANHIRR